ncbi:hypothetical protein TREES_T100020667 [Tupaia chinensis]|uniref:Uncharacterized protein n=1 Tax=Tupaia chinensis TaxID=246437 RepID=L9KKR6_TUPCH|nr:hypothetical protein TREES_T100020667 [Tupaia chinensis]
MVVGLPWLSVSSAHGEGAGLQYSLGMGLLRLVINSYEARPWSSEGLASSTSFKKPSLLSAGPFLKGPSLGPGRPAYPDEAFLTSLGLTPGMLLSSQGVIAALTALQVLEATHARLKQVAESRAQNRHGGPYSPATWVTRCRLQPPCSRGRREGNADVSSPLWLVSVSGVFAMAQVLLSAQAPPSALEPLSPACACGSRPQPSTRKQMEDTEARTPSARPYTPLALTCPSLTSGPSAWCFPGALRQGMAGALLLPGALYLAHPAVCWGPLGGPHSWHGTGSLALDSLSAAGRAQPSCDLGGAQQAPLLLLQLPYLWPQSLSCDNVELLPSREASRSPCRTRGVRGRGTLQGAAQTPSPPACWWAPPRQGVVETRPPDAQALLTEQRLDTETHKAGRREHRRSTPGARREHACAEYNRNTSISCADLVLSDLRAGKWTAPQRRLAAPTISSPSWDRYTVRHSGSRRADLQTADRLRPPGLCAAVSLQKKGDGVPSRQRRFLQQLWGLRSHHAPIVATAAHLPTPAGGAPAGHPHHRLHGCMRSTDLGLGRALAPLLFLRTPLEGAAAGKNRPGKGSRSSHGEEAGAPRSVLKHSPRAARLFQQEPGWLHYHLLPRNASASHLRTLDHVWARHLALVPLGLRKREHEREQLPSAVWSHPAVVPECEGTGCWLPRAGQRDQLCSSCRPAAGQGYAPQLSVPQGVPFCARGLTRPCTLFLKTSRGLSWPQYHGASLTPPGYGPGLLAELGYRKG